MQSVSNHYSIDSILECWRSSWNENEIHQSINHLLRLSHMTMFSLERKVPNFTAQKEKGSQLLLLAFTCDRKTIIRNWEISVCTKNWKFYFFFEKIMQKWHQKWETNDRNLCAYQRAIISVEYGWVLYAIRDGLMSLYEMWFSCQKIIHFDMELIIKHAEILKLIWLKVFSNREFYIDLYYRISRVDRWNWVNNCQ